MLLSFKVGAKSIPGNSCDISGAQILITGRNEVLAKVIFSQASVIHSVHRGGYFLGGGYFFGGGLFSLPVNSP